ncbi:Uncharacterised protein [uncultured Clostridium sp.]|uniref:hypothetical protein n=1 Tax=uncultured Clostridium sp. TaxID=59620 RepID=UPI00082085BE|nr:hypothetical protein [uncultured Clostridium sp.]SCI99633.1 Uncharacterised protein [uncultured Clostridium sp.]
MNEVMITSNNKVAFILYYKPEVKYQMKYKDNKVYFVFNRIDIEDLVMDFNDMLRERIPEYIDLKRWLDIKDFLSRKVREFKKKEGGK